MCVSLTQPWIRISSYSYMVFVCGQPKIRSFFLLIVRIVYIGIYVYELIRAPSGRFWLWCYITISDLWSHLIISAIRLCHFMHTNSISTKNNKKVMFCELMSVDVQNASSLLWHQVAYTIHTTHVTNKRTSHITPIHKHKQPSLTHNFDVLRM